MSSNLIFTKKVKTDRAENRELNYNERKIRKINSKTLNFHLKTMSEGEQRRKISKYFLC